MKNSWGLLGLFFLVCTSAAFAEDVQLTGLDEDAMPDYGKADDTPQGQWHFIAGTGPAYIPHYEGASGYWVRPVPIIQAVNGNFFAGTLGGIGYHFVKNRQYKFGVRIGAAPGRNESADSRLNGVGDLKAAGELGLFLKAGTDRFYYLAKISAGARGSRAEAGAGMDFNSGMQDVFRLGINVNVASANYMQTYFGISAGQSVTSGLPVYEASGGLRSYGAAISWTHIFERNLIGNMSLGAKQLAGSAVHSPLVQTETSASFAYVVMYLF